MRRCSGVAAVARGTVLLHTVLRVQHMQHILRVCIVASHHLSHRDAQYSVVHMYCTTKHIRYLTYFEAIRAVLLRTGVPTTVVPYRLFGKGDDLAAHQGIGTDAYFAAQTMT